MAQHIGLVLLAYLLGSLPFGLMISKWIYHIDIREHGSGNPGATNVWRVIGRGPGMVTLALDIVKGFLPVYLASILFIGNQWLAVLSGLGAIIGHNWSLFLKGKGGKGVATSTGVFFGLVPKHMGFVLVAFLLFFLTTRHVSIGSIAGALTLLIATFIIDTTPLIQAVALLASVLILIKHIPNIKRLAKGEEPKLKFK